jgi:hypothetical protein
MIDGPPSRPVCVHCGAKYGQRHTHQEDVRWPEGEPMPSYTGNGVVWKTSEPSRLGLKAEFLADQQKRTSWAGGLARKREEPDPRFYTDTPTMHAYREVWDGESWTGGYDPFCTLRCALSYARKAYAGRPSQ